MAPTAAATSASGALVPVHPEAVPGRPDQVRWVLPGDTLCFVGPVGAAPGALGRLLADGVVGSVYAEPAALLVTLGPSATWAGDGAEVRRALHDALARPEAWRPGAGAVRCSGDEALADAARCVLDGAAGAFVRSHGGTVELVGARDGVVSVRMGGSCRGCPAMAFTLGARLETALRAAYPSLKELRAVA